MSKDLFFLMREEEVATLNFLPTKKEIQQTSKTFAQKLIEEGELNLYEVYAQSVRLKEAITVIESELIDKLPNEAFESFGIKAVYRSGGDTINYSEDEVYQALKKDLDNRTELLKLAQKQEVIDMYGNEVPKVSTTPRKSSLAVSF
ncbi:hypothetical protein [Seonamhaeicola sp.]|uniref:hypothetical protein n=1 Tax=Seonamhaeicola sp. TaxID=1912245 RepID=UPI0035632B84